MKENCLWYWQKKRQGKCRKDSPELKDALLRRMLPPNNESITKISREEGISEQTLRNWRDKARKEGYAAPGTDAVPDDWSTQDKFLVVVETAGMNETELAEYARKKGLYIEQIKAWKDACMNANGGIAKEASRLNRELKDSEKERRKLEKELQRKGYVCFHPAIQRQPADLAPDLRPRLPRHRLRPLARAGAHPLDTRTRRDTTSQPQHGDAGVR